MQLPQHDAHTRSSSCCLANPDAYTSAESFIPLEHSAVHTLYFGAMRVMPAMRKYPASCECTIRARHLFPDVIPTFVCKPKYYEVAPTCTANNRTSERITDLCSPWRLVRTSQHRAMVVLVRQLALRGNSNPNSSTSGHVVHPCLLHPWLWTPCRATQCTHLSSCLLCERTIPRPMPPAALPHNGPTWKK